MKDMDSYIPISDDDVNTIRRKKALLERELRNGANLLGWSKRFECTTLAVLFETPELNRNLKRYFRKNPSKIYSHDTQGQTPLHLAASSGNTDMIDFFVKEMKVKVDLPDKQGTTAFVRTFYNPCGSDHPNAFWHLIGLNANVNVICVFTNLDDTTEIIPAFEIAKRIFGIDYSEENGFTEFPN